MSNLRRSERGAFRICEELPPSSCEDGGYDNRFWTRFVGTRPGSIPSGLTRLHRPALHGARSSQHRRTYHRGNRFQRKETCNAKAVIDVRRPARFTALSRLNEAAVGTTKLRGRTAWLDSAFGSHLQTGSRGHPDTSKLAVGTTTPRACPPNIIVIKKQQLRGIRIFQDCVYW